MMRAVQLRRLGGPEVLESVDLPTPEPGPTQVRIRHKAIGLNFIDTYQRTGLYPIPLPAVLGQEVAGVVEAVGADVSHVAVGDRVACLVRGGGYAEASVASADQLVRLPDAVDFDTAAAALLKGLTAELLARRLRPLHAGDTVLVHAAAGGVGSILVQWLVHLGIRVIGTAGSAEKIEIARRHGCAHVIAYREADVAAQVRKLTNGAGVEVAFDSVGKDTAEASLASLAKRGLFVSYGNASGPVAPIAPLQLSRGGSLFMTRPTLFDYIDTPERLQDAAKALFDVIASGDVKIEIGSRRPLSEVRQAHEALEARLTTGATGVCP
jgi:NADPH:quinone reductase